MHSTSTVSLSMQCSKLVICIQRSRSCNI